MVLWKEFLTSHGRFINMIDDLLSYHRRLRRLVLLSQWLSLCSLVFASEWACMGDQSWDNMYAGLWCYEHGGLPWLKCRVLGDFIIAREISFL